MMTPHNTDIERALKWLQNEAPNIQSLIKQKAQWYDRYHDRFWDDWYTTAFNIDTASDFGIVVWCVILGLSAEPFSFDPNEYSWAYGQNRQNFIYSGPLDPEQNPQFNAVGGNFFGGNAGAIGDINEIRKLLKLRYVALINNGSVHFVNKMLRHIFNEGRDWDFAAGQYFYLMDCTGAGQSGQLQVESMIANYNGDRADVVLRDYYRNQFIAFNNVLIQGASSELVDAWLPYFASAYKLTADGQGPAYIEFPTDSSVGVMTFQMLVKAGQRAQVNIDITNTASSRSSMLVDVATKSVVKTSGSILAFDLADDAEGYLRINLSVSILIENAVVRINIAENQAITSPSAGLVIEITAPMLTQGIGPAIYMLRDGFNTASAMDYSVVPSSGAITLGWMPGPNTTIGEPSIEWKGAWKGGSVDEYTQVEIRGTPNQLQIPVPPNSVAGVNDIMAMEYRIGPNGVLSDQAAVLLSQFKNGIIPTFAGCKISVVKETP